MRRKRFSVEDEVAWIRKHHGHAHFLERLFQNFKLAPSRDLAPIDNRDLRPLGSAAPIDVAHDQRVQKLGAERVTVHVVVLRKLGHHRERAKNFRECFGVAGAGRRFTIVFGKFQGVRQKKSVETRSRAGETIAAVLARQAFLFRAQTELREQGAIFERGSNNPFAKSGDRFGNDPNALLVF